MANEFLQDVMVALNRTKVTLENQSKRTVPKTRNCAIVCSSGNLEECKKVCQPVTYVKDLSHMATKFPQDAQLLQTHPDIINDIKAIRNGNLAKLTEDQIRYVLTLPSSFVLLDDDQWVNAFNAMSDKSKMLSIHQLKARAEHIPIEYKSTVGRRLKRVL